MKIDLFSGQSLTRVIAATTTASASVQLPAIGNSLRIANEGAAAVYISVGTGAQVATVPSTTAAATCSPVLAGQDVVFSIPADSRLNISVIAATGTANVNVSVGEGS